MYKLFRVVMYAIKENKTIPSRKAIRISEIPRYLKSLLSEFSSSFISCNFFLEIIKPIEMNTNAKIGTKYLKIVSKLSFCITVPFGRTIEKIITNTIGLKIEKM